MAYRVFPLWWSGLGLQSKEKISVGVSRIPSVVVGLQSKEKVSLGVSGIPSVVVGLQSKENVSLGVSGIPCVVSGLGLVQGENVCWRVGYSLSLRGGRASDYSPRRSRCIDDL